MKIRSKTTGLVKTKSFLKRMRFGRWELHDCTRTATRQQIVNAMLCTLTSTGISTTHRILSTLYKRNKSLFWEIARQAVKIDKDTFRGMLLPTPKRLGFVPVGSTYPSFTTA